MRIVSRWFRFGGAAAVIFAVAACTTVRPHADYLLNFDFSEYQTFMWISDEPLIRPSGQSDPFASPLDLQRIQRAIESELTAKGFRQVDDPSQADFAVSFTIGTRDKIDTFVYPGYYDGRWSSRYWGTMKVRSYTEGVLAIDIFDQALKEPVWHGGIQKRVTGSQIDNPGELIKTGVAAILQQFPPRGTQPK